MCDKCIELDAKIERYRQLAAGVTDRRALESIKTLSDLLQAEKTALHPEKR
jgi:hypothetical protein